MALKCWSKTFFIIQCHKSFTLLTLFKLMIFFCFSLNLYSAPILLAVFLCCSRVVSLHWFEFSQSPNEEWKSIKKSPEQKQQHQCERCSWYILTMIDYLTAEGERERARDTRACLLANFSVKSNTRGRFELGIGWWRRIEGQRRNRREKREAKWLIVKNYSFFNKAHKQPCWLLSADFFILPETWTKFPARKNGAARLNFCFVVCSLKMWNDVVTNVHLPSCLSLIYCPAL